MCAIDLVADLRLVVLDDEPALLEEVAGAAGELHPDDRVATAVGDEDAKAARPWEDVLADLKARRQLSPSPR